MAEGNGRGAHGGEEGERVRWYSLRAIVQECKRRAGVVKGSEGAKASRPVTRQKKAGQLGRKMRSNEWAFGNVWAGSDGCFLQWEAQHSTSSTWELQSLSPPDPQVTFQRRYPASGPVSRYRRSCPSRLANDRNGRWSALSRVTSDEMSYLLPRPLPRNPANDVEEVVLPFEV